MARRIMIVDRSGSLRRILKNMILANINDAEVAEVSDADEARERLSSDPGDFLVLFSGESVTDEWLDFIRQSLARAGRCPLVFVLFTSRAKQDLLKKVKEAGVKERLAIPCTPESLTEIVNLVYNPLVLRDDRRYSIQDTIASFDQRGQSFKASVINISKGGMLCEMAYDEAFKWAAPVMASVTFTAAALGDQVTAAGLYSTVSRLLVQNAYPDFSPKTIRIAMQFISVPPDAMKVLEGIFAKADTLHGNSEVCLLC